VIGYLGDEGGLKLALFANDGTNEGIVVFEERIRLCRATRLVK